MTLREFILETTELLVFIPAAVICYLPMKNQLKISGVKIFLCILAAFCVFIPLITWLCFLLDHNVNTLLLPILGIFFIIYQFTVKTDFFRSFAIFTFSCVISAFPANFAYTFDAWLHPDGTSAGFSWQAGLFQLALTTVLTLLLSVPLRKYGSRLIDMINIPSVWISVISVSSIFLLLSIAIIPHNYSTLYVGRCFPIYIILLIVMLILLLFLYITLYCIAVGIQKNADLTDRIRFFEMQESQYMMQKRYIEETSKQRHDFRQSIFTLNRLAEEGDLSSMKEYLVKYAEMLPKTETTRYCRNNAVNALLNYYAQSASDSGIRIEWSIGLPDKLTISEPDFCSLLGNMIENSISGCMTVSDEENRYHYLSVTVKNDVNLYIVSTNSFNGVVKRKDGRYLSTKRRGNGIGIHSMNMVAEKYHGVTRFHNSDSEFYVDIMLILPKEDL